jgi:hypothetical protein
MNAVVRASRIVEAFGGPDRAPWEYLAALHLATVVYVLGAVDV